MLGLVIELPSAQLRAVAVVVPGPYFGENLPPLLSKKACFSYDLSLSIELAYIDCIFLPMHRLYFFLSSTSFRFYVVL